MGGLGFCACGKPVRSGGQKNCKDCHRIAQQEYRKRKRKTIAQLKRHIRMLEDEVFRMGEEIEQLKNK
jgi:predicted RNase H-like nuclease (RuvC/YqgF family)